MAALTAEQAVEDFLSLLRSGAECVTHSRLNRLPGDEPSRGQWVLGDGPPLALHHGPQGLILLSATMHYDVVRVGDLFSVRTRSYQYAVMKKSKSLPRPSQVLRWDLHPHSRVSTPHLHVGPEGLANGMLNKDQHLPCGRIAFEEVILFLIEELGVPTLVPDAPERLRRSLAQFLAVRSWSSVEPDELRRPAEAL